MKLTDLRTLEAGTTVHADVCIVGSGPAGLTLARELDGSGLKVVVVESGGAEREEWAESLGEIVSVGTPRVMDPGEVSNRALGGASATWGGRIARLSDLDLRERDWVPDSGWPISSAALDPYYLRAARHLNLPVSEANHPGIQRYVARSIPPPEGDALLPFLWSYSMNNSARPDFLRFGPVARDLPLDNVQCFIHATATHIDTDELGRVVRRVEVKAPDLTSRWIDAREIVLCAGGLENARLMLASNRVVPTGIGNNHDLVGRFLMDHPRGQVATFPPESRDLAQLLLGDFLVRPSDLPSSALVPGPRRRVWLTPGFALGERTQEREELLNCALFLTPEISDDDPLTALLSLAGQNDALRNSRRLLSHPSLTARSLVRILRGRYPTRLASHLYAQCIVEQRPNRESRIALSDRVDALGVPLGLVDWRTSEQEARTVRCTTDLFITEMARLGLAPPEPLPMIGDESREFFLPDVAHPSGTTRMSDGPENGVVDANCAVHGVDGLHILGSSVFPTNGHANPTYTVVALAVRLADRLKVKLRAERSRTDAASSPERHSATAAQAARPHSDGPLRIGVTGAQGYVGSAISTALTAAGHHVVALTRRPDDLHEHRAYDLEAPILPDLLDGIDAVIHCAYAWGPTEWDEIVRVNVEGTQRLLEASVAAGARFVLISSVSAFDGTRQHYGNAKLLTERLTLDADGTVVRLGTVHGGSNGGMFGLLLRFARLPVIPVFGARSQQALISIENLTAAMVKLVESRTAGGQLIGLASPSTIAFGQLMRELASSDGKRRLVFPVPWKPLYLLLRSIERAGVQLPVGSELVVGLAETTSELASTDFWETLGVRIDPPELTR